MTNLQRFQTELTAAYTQLFVEQPETYGYAIARQHTPSSLAAKMTAGLADGSANHDGDGIKRACKSVGIKPTRTAIRAFLNATN